MLAPSEFDTPILFMVLNRPDVTQTVFDVIRAMRPRRLFVAADGPRSSRPGEEDKCAVVRKIATNVDWPCSLQTLFRNDNLGCKVAVTENISWFFQQVDRGIILEDDCLPSFSFFHYCQELLNRYEQDNRVVHINGNNFNANDLLTTGFSYHFTYFSQVWGWATWRRAWARYDPQIELFTQFDSQSFFAHAGIDDRDFAILKKKWNNVRNGRIDTWDYQWHFINLLEGSLAISPTINLISNIGFGDDATHTRDKQSEKQMLDRFDFKNALTHPPCLFVDSKMNQLYKRRMIREPKFDKLIRRILKNTY